jgi:AraC family transcriptional activator of tynA and feaB
MAGMAKKERGVCGERTTSGNHGAPGMSSRLDPKYAVNRRWPEPELDFGGVSGIFFASRFPQVNPVLTVSARMEWLTKATRTDRPFGSWADDLADAFVQLEPRKVSDAPFFGSISKTDLAPIHISRVLAAPHCVARRHTHIGKGGSDFYFLNLQIDGLACSVQRGHEQVCGPGDLAVVDTTEPFEIMNHRKFNLLCFAVPRQLLPMRFAERPRLTLSSTEMGRALARTLSGYADLCIGSAAAPLVPAMGDHLLDLLSHADRFVTGKPPARVRPSVQLSMMLDHLDRHFAEVDFGAARLARKFGCSLRYVHKLFGGTGRSVGEHVNDRRILASARNLLDPGCRMTIAEIAFAAGFSDISHFNRLFKRCHGLSPRDFRNSRSSNT